MIDYCMNFSIVPTRVAPKTLDKIRVELIDKFEIYEEAGVKEYWVIHPKKKYFYIYQLNEHQKYKSTGGNFYNKEVISAVFPEFKFNLEDLYRARVGFEKWG